MGTDQKILESLGKRHTEQVYDRDAVHVALIQGKVGEKLYPGHPVGVTKDSSIWASGTGIGVLDPFLPGPVYPGDWVSVFLYPLTVTDMRHHWIHPELDAGVALKEEESEQAVNTVYGEGTIPESCLEGKTYSDQPDATVYYDICPYTCSC